MEVQNAVQCNAVRLLHRNIIGPLLLLSMLWVSMFEVLYITRTLRSSAIKTKMEIGTDTDSKLLLLSHLSPPNDAWKPFSPQVYGVSKPYVEVNRSSK